MKSLLIAAVVIVALWYVAKSQGWITPSPVATGSATAPIDRARTAAAASQARTSQGQSASREADQPAGGGSVTENMTPDQVRGLLGNPDDVSNETTASGAPRETWTYRNVGKSVVFENGVVTGVH
jgi:hypothetical protein